MIDAKGVTLKYGDGTLALKGIDLKVGSGELVYITGPSGSGKTSLIKLFMGIEHPTSGSLRVMGHDIAHGKHSEIREMRRHIGPVFQEFRLMEGRTAMENVIMGMRFLNISPEQMKKNAINALERVGLCHKAKSMAENLSWGETQRVAIARAVARDPSLILADEPTGNLDQANAVNILELLNSFRDENTAVIITTHATHLIQGQRDATYINMDEGKISMEGRGEVNEKSIV